MASCEASGGAEVQGATEVTTRRAILSRELDYMNQVKYRMHVCNNREKLSQLLDDSNAREAAGKLYDLGLLRKDEHEQIFSVTDVSNKLITIVLKKNCLEMYAFIDILINDLDMPLIEELFVDYHQDRASQAVTRRASLSRELSRVDQERLRTNFSNYKEVLAKMTNDKAKNAADKLYGLDLLQKDEHEQVVSERNTSTQAFSALFDLLTKKDCLEMFSFLDIVKSDLHGLDIVKLFAPEKDLEGTEFQRSRRREEEGEKEEGSNVKETTSSSRRTEGEGETAEISLSNFHKQLPGIIMEIDKKIGISSYYLRSDDYLVVHPKVAADAEDLKKCFDEMRHASPAKFTFGVDAKPAFATFSYAIQSGKSQSFGMYVQVNNAVYWVSTAHGLVSEEIHQKLDGHKESGLIHVGRRKPVKFCLPGNGASFRMPTPYVCFDASKTNRYLEDIALGPLTVSPKKLEADGGFCFRRYDLHNVTFQKAQLFCTATKPQSEEPLHMCNRLRSGCKVISYSTCNSEALVGHLSTQGQAKFFSINNGIASDHWTPFFVIENRGEVKPRKGHSGSIWALESTDGIYQAVAMTNAIGLNGKLWYATPLCCLLDSIKKTYSKVFESTSLFEGIGFFLPKTS